MLSRRLFIIAALFTSAILYTTSCIEVNKSLGDQFLPDDFVLRIDTAQFDIPVSTATLDSIQGFSSNYIMFGYINDEKFGYTKCSGASLIAPYTDSTYLGINPKVKSIYLQFSIDSVFALKDEQKYIPQNISIHKLIRPLDSTKVFNTSLSELDYDPTPIHVGSPVFFGDDSLKIHLTKEFGQELLATTVSEFDSTALFRERIKGFYITTDEPEVGVNEGRINYLPINASSIYIEYLLTDPKRGFYNKDTTITFLFGYNYAVNSIKTSSKHLLSESTEEKLYIESLDGIKPYIKAEDLKKILDDWMADRGLSKENLLIARAAFEFPFEMTSKDNLEISRYYPKQIYPCVKSSDENSSDFHFLSPLPEIYTNSYVGEINRSSKSYICDVTNYIQKIVKNDSFTEYDNVYISPILSYIDSDESQYYGFDNQNYKRGFLNGTGAERKPTLKITYSIFNQ